MFSGGWHWGSYRTSDIQTNKTQKQQSNGKDVKLSQEEISSIISEKLKKAAEVNPGTKVTFEVVSAADYFRDKQFQPTKDPGTSAGLNVMSLFRDAISNDYRSLDLSCPKEKNVVIIEIARGTLVVSIINFNKDGNISVRASSGNTHFGGEDFDMLMVKPCVQEFKKTKKEGVAHNAKPMMRLRVSSEVAKRYLLSATHTLIKVNSLFDGIDFSIKFSSEKFDEINAPYFIKCLEHVKICLRNAKIHKQDVDDVVIVNGSTYINHVLRQLLMQFFDEKPTFKRFNVDELVVYGATILALYLGGNGNKLLQDVTPQSSIKIGRSGNLLRRLIKKMQQKINQFYLQ